jgi:transcriptional regulator with XRE-family HTH domain
VEVEIAETLRKVRRERKWTQASLAFRLGITVDWLRKIELGHQTPAPKLLEKIKSWLADPNARLR